MTTKTYEFTEEEIAEIEVGATCSCRELDAAITDVHTTKETKEALIGRHNTCEEILKKIRN